LKTLFTNINQLVQVRAKHIPKIDGLDMKNLPCLENAYLIIKNGLIEDYGLMENLPANFDGQINDLTGKIVLPSWNDSHTHLVFAEPRANEFVDRLNGLSYEEIARKGGGILNSAKALSKLSENALFEHAIKRLNQAISMGTGAIEIKSGYGLDVENEIKMLKVIDKLKRISPIPIKSTLLAAHAIPTKYKNNKSEYIKIITDELIPKVAKENLADYIDVFCEKGYFTVSDTNKIISCGVNYGLIPKIHTNQFNIIGGVKVAINHNALSVDHLELLDNNDIRALKKSNTICTTLPACSFS
jgi:imidazolonepropionase